MTNVATFREALTKADPTPRHSALPRSQRQPDLRGPQGGRIGLFQLEQSAARSGIRGWTGKWRGKTPHLAGAMRRIENILRARCSSSRPVSSSGVEVVGSEREISPNEVVEHRKTEVANDATGERATLHAAVFETRAATLKVIDQPNPPRGDLAAAMARTHASRA